MIQVSQNSVMMNMINQLAQQMDGNQDLTGMFSGSSGGNLDIWSIVQQMNKCVSQDLNCGSGSGIGTSTSNFIQSTPSKKAALHRRYNSVRNSKDNEKWSDFKVCSDQLYLLSIIAM